MARKRKKSLESKTKSIVTKALPVVVGVSAVGAGLYFFGNNQYVAPISMGLRGETRAGNASWFGGWFG